jgi:type IV fimbrial biogenesis protein FimT
LRANFRTFGADRRKCADFRCRFDLASLVSRAHRRKSADSRRWSDIALSMEIPARDLLHNDRNARQMQTCPGLQSVTDNKPANEFESSGLPMLSAVIRIERRKATPAEHSAVTRRRILHAPCIARGFTLSELCATLAVLAILSTLAAGSMSSTLSNNRVYAAQDELVAYVAFARSEAVRRGTTVIVGAIAPVSGNGFGGGWNVWVDDNGNGAYDAGETLLRTHEALPSNIIVGNGSINAIAFTSMGFLTPGAAVAVKVCPSDPALGGFNITIQPNGLTDIKAVASHTTPCN